MELKVEKNIQNLCKLEAEQKKFFLKKKKIEKEFFKKNNGLVTCKKISNITDIFLKSLFGIVIKKYSISNSEFVVCATGGYGRGHLAPYSDIDILFVMFSHTKKVKSAIENFLLTLWDMGFRVGHATRTLKEIISSAKNNVIIQTSLLDNRRIAGNKILFLNVRKEIENFFKNNNSENFILSKISERKKRLLKNDYDSYLLEPNIKETLGGLRDINLLFWYFKIIYKTDKFKSLLDLKVLTINEIKKLKKSMDFIFTIRCYLHFLNHRPFERLLFDFQKKISEKLKYKSRSFTSCTERFMKHYYLQIKNVKNITDYNLDIKNLSSNKIEKNTKFLTNGTVICDNAIFIDKTVKFLDDDTNFLKIFLDSERTNLPLHPRSFRFICNNISSLGNTFFLKNSVGKLFFEILISNSENNNLFMMNDSGLLLKIIPEFSNITARSQFDLYHAYTVDHHTLRALEFIKKLNANSEKYSNLMHPNKVSRQISCKLVLYLSVLLHDIGKGSGKNHTEKGAKLAKKVLKNLKLKKSFITEVIWLIKNHLIFSEFAFNKDINDNSVLKKFLEIVNTKEKLRTLYILTVADIGSVNKNNWNSWKASLLNKLFEKSMVELNKPFIEKFDLFNNNQDKKIPLIQKKVLLHIRDNSENQFRKFCSVALNNFWLTQQIQDIVEIIDFFFSGEQLKQTYNYLINKTKIDGVFKVTVVTKDKRKLFLKIIQKFLKNKMEVLEAKAFTFRNGVIVDTFKIELRKDINFSQLDFEKKKNELIEDFKNLQNIELDLGIEKITSMKKNIVLTEKNSISIDSSVSKEYTTIKIFCSDRPFLLFDILKVFTENKLNIYFAKISTLGDFIEDTFHVKTSSGNQITNLNALGELEKQLKSKILSNE